MSILTVEDFTSDVVVAYLHENSIKADKYYKKGDNYYQTLLNEYGVNRDYIPIESEVSDRVRDALVMYVNCAVADDNIDPFTRDVMNNEAVPDPWKARSDVWCPKIEKITENLVALDFYDPNNLPPVDEGTAMNPKVKHWELG